MKETEARLYFPESEEESIEELYEQKVFEWKNFFVNRFPVSKLFSAKLIQMATLQEAYEVLTNHESKVRAVDYNSAFPSTLKEAFLHFEKERSRFKQRLFQSDTLAQILVVAGPFVAVTSEYAKVWRTDTDDFHGVVVSKETDVMDLLKALDDAEHMGVTKASDIFKLPENHLVQSEMKRLSLWIKMDNNE